MRKYRNIIDRMTDKGATLGNKFGYFVHYKTKSFVFISVALLFGIVGCIIYFVKKSASPGRLK